MLSTKEGSAVVRGDSALGRSVATSLARQTLAFAPALGPLCCACKSKRRWAALNPHSLSRSVACASSSPAGRKRRQEHSEKGIQLKNIPARAYISPTSLV
jgi:hypothetical protein